MKSEPSKYKSFNMPVPTGVLSNLLQHRNSLVATILVVGSAIFLTWIVLHFNGFVELKLGLDGIQFTIDGRSNQ